MFSSALGKADSLEVVVNASIAGSRTALRNLRIGTFAKSAAGSSTTRTKTASAP